MEARLFFPIFRVYFWFYYLS